MTEEMDVSRVFESLSPIFWKKGRLETFKHWPFKSENHQCNPDNMARAGFYAIGGKDEPDLAECFMCCKQLDGWEPDDDPWLEHKKHQPNCQFIKLDKPEEQDLTLIELFQLVQNFYKHKMNLDFEKAVESIKRTWKDSANTIPDIYEAMKKSRKNLD
ncbi:hypothetical protein TSAR_001899 [Trichomalopsis sarcophagae]|uniref:Uncharacterized protein n=1 Tax=Trichomalopsis sarcophagae TaxID=543379 RepID=A0A232FJR9_9HYME|nr:hypothetical protein TSAR_001899 [Trichomalopsis sarcophagae]